jgi:hypothetical protein
MLKFCDRSAARLTVGEEPWRVVLFKLKYSGRGRWKVNWSPGRMLKLRVPDPKPLLEKSEAWARGMNRSFCPPNVGGAGRKAAKGDEVSMISSIASKECRWYESSRR